VGGGAHAGQEAPALPSGEHLREHAALRGAEAPVAMASRLTVWVVDDSPVQGGEIARALHENAGHTAVTCRSSAEALREARGPRPTRTSVSQVADLAARARPKRLSPIHHDCEQNDDAIDAKLARARELLAKANVPTEVVAPEELTTEELQPCRRSPISAPAPSTEPSSR
jgi:hypothetical protein